MPRQLRQEHGGAPEQRGALLGVLAVDLLELATRLVRGPVAASQLHLASFEAARAGHVGDHTADRDVGHDGAHPEGLLNNTNNMNNNIY